MRVTSLASGSKGNCLYIEGENGAILIDAGLSVKETRTRLGYAGGKLDLINAILVTHEHTDHIAGVRPLARKLNIPIIGSRGTLSEITRTLTSHQHVVTMACRAYESYHVGSFSFEPFATSHDALEPLGFCVREGDLMVGCCTDTGIISPPIVDRLGRCDMVILESNHCPHMLKTGPYPLALKRRIRSKRGHLSNLAAASYLQQLRNDVPIILLAHLSEINNTPLKAMASAQEALGLYFSEVDVSTSPQHHISVTKCL